MDLQVNPSKRTPFNILTYPLKPSLIVGGVATGRRPFVSALTVAGTWFGFAQVFWYSRLVCTRALTEEGNTPTSTQKLLYSTVAGGVSGSLNGALQRGPRSAFPTAVFLSGISFLGQAAVNAFPTSAKKAGTEGSFKDRLAKSSWNPLKPVAEEEYEKLLVSKLEKTKADIAAIDEKIKAARIALASQPDDQTSLKK
ncbi:hypothetical protein UCRPC4_g01339 [Phaeomoniella chlamydospora]|uniref:Uncharacterized protein n=1 Tax=Phaeomoniella chlamydospora TaxID=158046 RepID=A0A0G2EWG5_PHACM|nr:hypothetical protein UCRPC4_g01339 [Phaeomoniella chlamydospora]